MHMHNLLYFEMARILHLGGRSESAATYPHSVLPVTTVGVGITMLHVLCGPSQLLACKHLYAEHTMRRLGHPMMAVAKSV